MMASVTCNLFIDGTSMLAGSVSSDECDNTVLASTPFVKKKKSNPGYIARFKLKIEFLESSSLIIFCLFYVCMYIYIYTRAARIHTYIHMYVSICRYISICI